MPNGVGELGSQLGTLSLKISRVNGKHAAPFSILSSKMEGSVLPAAWRPHPASDLLRLGSEGDGGYVVARRAVLQTTLLLSMGLNDDWRFEEDFLRISNAVAICYDGSVNNRFWALYAVKKFLRFRPHKALHYFAYRRFFGSGRAEHRRVMIGYDRPGSVSLATILAERREQDIFLKVDIEGWEYRIFDDIVRHQTRFSGVVIEFHDVDLHRNRIETFIRAMTLFKIVDLNANNFGGSDDNDDPIVIEISLMREALADALSPSGHMSRHPNNPGAPPIEVKFEKS